MGAGWLQSPFSRHSAVGVPSSTNPVLHENVTARPCVRVLGGTTPPLARTPGAGQKGKHSGTGLLHTGPTTHVVDAAPDR